MRKKYCIGFFVAIFMIVICLELGYRWKDHYIEEKQEEQTELSMSMVQDEKMVTAKAEGKKNSEYLLKELNGYVIVYLSDEKTVYEVTGIAISELPDEVQTQVREGMKLYSADELYAFLENYSS